MLPAVKLNADVDGPELAMVADLPEGGYVWLVAGKSSLAAPATMLKVPVGGMVGVFPKEQGQKFMHVELGDVGELPPVVRLEKMPAVCGIEWLDAALLPSGGFLNVTIGHNIAALPQPSTPVPEWSLVVVVPTQIAEVFRQGWAAMLRQMQNPYAITRNGEVGQ